MDFLNEDLEELRISKGPPATTARDRCIAVFYQMADEGSVPRNYLVSEAVGQAFKFELKNKLVRFPCFQDGKMWVLTFGFFKPGAQKGRGKWPPEKVARAKNLLEEYRQRKKALGGA